MEVRVLRGRRVLEGLGLVFALGLGVIPTAAVAQQVWPIPLPEENQEEPPPEAPAPAPTSPAPAPAPAPSPSPAPSDSFSFDGDVLSSYAVRQGQIGIGAGVVPSLNLTLNGAILPMPSAGFSGTYVLAISPQFSYFVIDGVEVGGFVGPILRHRLRSGLGAGTFLASLPWPELAGNIGAFAAYHYPVTDGVLLIGTVGGGPILGASGAPDVVGGGVDLSIVAGVLGFVRGGAGYMFNRNFQVRVEGEASAITDFEFATGATLGIAVSGMINTGVRLSVHGYF